MRREDPGPDGVGCALLVVLLAIAVACAFAADSCRAMS